MKSALHPFILAVALSTTGLPAASAVPSLAFNAYAQSYGFISASYSSALLGDVSFTVNTPSVYQNNYLGSGRFSTGVAQQVYDIPAGQGSADPVYAIITNAGQYGFHIDTQAEVAGLLLRTKGSTLVTDSSTKLAVDSMPNATLNAYAWAQWNQQFYIPPSGGHAAGEYGAVLMGISMYGTFPAVADGVTNNAYANSSVVSRFTDTAGVQYDSSFGLSASAGDSAWTGSSLTFKKLLFQYGTPFSVEFYQYNYLVNTAEADFFHTSFIHSIEIPWGATLESGASQAGLGSLDQLYGNVFNSATADAENTTWDFGNNGGGFTPNVPEPGTWAMFLSGLAAMAGLLRRRRPR